MEYVNYDQLPRRAKTHIDSILGSLPDSSPRYVAVLNNVEGWVLYEVRYKSICELDLSEKKRFRSLVEVLAFFRVQGLTPLYPRLEIED